MYSNPQQIICITGADGSGKSTLTAGLAKVLGPVYVSHIWDSLERHPGILFQSKKDIDVYLCSLTPDARLLFLAHALQYSIDRAARSGAAVVLVNAYYYKYFTTELALGAHETLVKNLAANFPPPHKVLRLQIEPEMAAVRKPFFSRYECGLAEKPDAEAFAGFQHKALAYWYVFNNTHFHNLDASQLPETILQQALAIIRTV